MYTPFHSSTNKDSAKPLQSHSTCSVPGLADSKFSSSALKKAKSKDDLQLEQTLSSSSVSLESKLSSRVSLSVYQASLQEQPSSTGLDLEGFASLADSISVEPSVPVSSDI
ncbi:hypothetical protein L0F63_002389, partial [Massospora cicadina]